MKNYMQIDYCRKFQKIITLSIFLLASLFWVDRAVANTGVENGKIAFHPLGGMEVERYTNATNTGFTIEANLTETEFDHANINLNGLAVATINLKGWLEYGLEGITNSELQTYFPIGSNVVDLEVCTTPLICSVVDSVTVVGDYTAAAVNWDFVTTVNKKDLAIGDSCDFVLDSNEDIDLVSASYNGRSLILEDAIVPPADYILNYTVMEADEDQLQPLQFSDWKFVDMAGNITTLNSLGIIDFTIDAKYPVVNLNSPLNGKIYNISQIPFIYSFDEKVTVVVELDGLLTNVINDGFLFGLSEGDHSIRLEATDLSGNVSVISSYFKVDTIAPFVSYNLSKNNFSVDEKIILQGSAEPRSTISLEVGGYNYIAVADINGKWAIEIDCKKIGQGNFSLSLAVIDLAGNETKRNLGWINIGLEQSSVLQQQSGVLALGNSSDVKSDIKPKIINAQVGASSPQQVFAPTEKDTEKVVLNENSILDINAKDTNGLNWSIILVTLGVIALVSAAIAAGYYGYEFIVLSNIVSFKKRVRYKQERQQINKTNSASKEVRSKKNMVTDTPKTKDEDNISKTRW
jgi:hypothetical protein